MFLKSMFFCAFCLFCSNIAIAQCNPRDFMIRETTSWKEDISLKYAFLLSASESEYNSASQQAGGGYSGFSGNFAADKQQARTATKDVSVYQNENYARDYFTRRLSQAALDGYKSCLQTLRRSPGIYLWLAERHGDLLTFEGFWIGRDTTQPIGHFDEPPVVEGGTLISGPGDWAKGEDQRFLVKRSGNVDVILAMRIEGRNAFITFVKDPPLTIETEASVLSEPYSVQTIRQNNCSAQTRNICIRPSPGRAFRAKSGAIVDSASSEPSRYRATIVTDTPSLICAEIIQSTSDCGKVRTATGRLQAQEFFSSIPPAQ